MKTKPLSPAEWDFRSIEEWELLTTVIYEYTRSSGRLCDVIKQWHTQPFDVTSLKDDIWEESTKQVYNALKRQRKNLTNADVIRIAGSLPDSTDLTLVRLALWVTLFPTIRNIKVTKADRIATRFEDLSLPWSVLKQQNGADYLKKRCLSFQKRGCGFLTAWNDRMIKEAMAFTPSLRMEHVLIDWAETKENITTDFKQWLDDNHPGISRERRRKSGPKAKWEWLKRLAAFRISQSGRKFLEARKCVVAHLNKSPRQGSFQPVVPDYRHQGAWDKAANKAKSALHGDFTAAILSDFGFLL